MRTRRRPGRLWSAWLDDVRYRELTYPRPVVYVAWAQQMDMPPLSIVVARGTAGDALAARDANRLVREIEPGVLVTSVATMRQRLTTSLARPRFDAVVLGVFAGVALVLAAVGVYWRDRRPRPTTHAGNRHPACPRRARPLR